MNYKLKLITANIDILQNIKDTAYWGNALVHINLNDYVQAIHTAKSGDISFYVGTDIDIIHKSNASVIFVNEQLQDTIINISELNSRLFIFCADAMKGFILFLHAHILQEYFPIVEHCSNNVLIESNAIIGKNVIFQGNNYIHDNVIIGDNVIVQGGAVIGGSGFGHIPHGEENILFPQLGKTIIKNNVHIGANTCIDRGSFNNTIIGNNVKIDNLVHIAHNVKIDASARITAGVTFGGSVYVGKRAYLGLNSVIKPYVNIGDDALIGMGAAVIKDVPANMVAYGVPAHNHSKGDST